MFLTNLIPVARALKIIDNTIIKTEVEKIPLEEAYQRILAEDSKKEFCAEFPPVFTAWILFSRACRILI